MSEKNQNSQPDQPAEGKKEENGKFSFKKIKLGPPSSRQMGSWLLILVLIPMFFMLFSPGKRSKALEISASQFEFHLQQGHILEVVVSKMTPSSLITGKMKNQMTGANQQPGESVIAFQSQVVYTERLDKMIAENCPNRQIKIATTAFTDVLVSLLPTLLLIILFFVLFSRMMKSAGKGAMQFGKSRAKMLDSSSEKVTLKDVAGIVEAKEDMQEIVDYLKDPGKFRRLGGKIPRGVLMVGPPGTGKTLLAKAIAGEADVPFFSISGSDFVEMFVGVGASRVRDMFEEGHKHAPCLIFIDEIDAVGRSRFSGIGGGHDEREQTLNALLVEMDGFEPNSGVIVLAATNRPDVLDPALLRPGRFDRQIAIDLPDQRGRFAILGIHAKKVKMDPKVDLHVIARATPGFSGADLANLINEAALLATRRNLDAVGMAELEESRDKVRWGKERRSRRLDEKDRKLTAYHESGHALVGMLCKYAMPLHKITIIPRGMALGATMQLPEQDKVSMTRNELLDHVAVCFGGRVAEELIFQDITTGAAMDIQDATNTIKKMVCQWGMSDKLELINYGGREEHIFVGRDITRSEDFSPETAREIDLEIRRMIEAQHERVRKLLTDNKDKLVLLSETLLERETMNAKEVYELLDMPMPESSRTAQDLENDRESDDEVQAREAIAIASQAIQSMKEDAEKASAADKAGDNYAGDNVSAAAEDCGDAPAVPEKDAASETGGDAADAQEKEDPKL